MEELPIEGKGLNKKRGSVLIGRGGGSSAVGARHQKLWT